MKSINNNYLSFIARNRLFGIFFKKNTRVFNGNIRLQFELISILKKLSIMLNTKILRKKNGEKI